MNSIPKTNFKLSTFSTKNYNKYQKEKNKNIFLYMSSETTYTNKNNTSYTDNNSYVNEKEATSNASTPWKKKDTYYENELRNKPDLIRFKNNKFLTTTILTVDKKKINSIPESTIQKTIPHISFLDAKINTSNQYNLPINKVSFLTKINTTNIKLPYFPTNPNHNYHHEKNRKI